MVPASQPSQRQPVKPILALITALTLSACATKPTQQAQASCTKGVQAGVASGAGPAFVGGGPAAIGLALLAIGVAMEEKHTHALCGEVR
jgi:hypothetical protein